MKKKIAIIGYGFVGKATADGFSNNTELLLIDPKLGTSIDQLKNFNPEFTFVCVPTPMADDGKQDNSILVSVFKDLKKMSINTIVILKSTVLPDTVENLENNFSSFVYNPEFLREKYATEDFINSEFIILGGKKDDCEIVKKLYQENSKCLSNNFLFTSPSKASLSKYIINTFLALKVLYFNEIFELAKLEENEWQELIDIVNQDSRIGSSHMKVPGPDGRKGFGGACFPKDTQALYNFSINQETELKLLKKAIELNNNIRKEYKELSSREAEQNVKFRN